MLASSSIICIRNYECYLVLEAFYASIKMPASLRAAGVKEEDLPDMAEKAVERGNLGILTSIGREEALQIMRDAF